MEVTNNNNKGLFPILRFKSFEEEWKIKKGADLFTSSRKKGNETLPIYSVTLDKGMVPRNSLERHMGNDAKSDDNLFVGKNQICYNMMRMWQGAFGLSPVDCMVSPAYVVLNAKDEVSPDFMIKYFNRKRSLYFFTAYSYGLTSDRLRLYFKDFAQIKFAIPPLNEQQKIASFLSAVDEKIQQLTRKRELLQQYKKGVMQQIFSHKIRFKDENGKAFPEWEEKRLGEMLIIGSGRDYKHLKEGDVPVFGTGGYMLSVNEKIYSGETVFIGRKGTIDKPFYYNGDFWTVDTLFYTYDFKNVLPKFIYYIFLQINFKLYNEASGVPSLSKTTLEKIKLPVPCFKEQQRITNYLSGIDKKIDTIAIQITQTQTFKKGLLQQMFC